MRLPGRRAGGVPLVAALLVGVGACGSDGPRAGAVGGPAPHFEAADLEGRTVALEDLREDVVLLNIWATWCPPCREEMPDLQSLHEEFRDQGLRVVGVSIDGAGSDRAIERFLAEFDISFLILRDPADRVSGAFAAWGVPASFLIDRDGNIRWRHMGPVTADDPQLRESLETLLPAG